MLDDAQIPEHKQLMNDHSFRSMQFMDNKQNKDTHSKDNMNQQRKQTFAHDNMKSLGLL